MSFVTQILLPMHDNSGRRFGRSHFVAFHARMIRKYGGWTRKGLAEGAWLSPAGDFHSDEHWVYEIGHPRRDRQFWRAEKERLKTEFDQEEIWIIQYQGRLI